MYIHTYTIGMTPELIEIVHCSNIYGIFNFIIVLSMHVVKTIVRIKYYNNNNDNNKSKLNQSKWDKYKKHYNYMDKVDNNICNP